MGADGWLSVRWRAHTNDKFTLWHFMLSLMVNTVASRFIW